MSKNTVDLFEEGFDKILEGLDTLGYDTKKDENFHGTARRAAKGLAQLVLNQNEVKGEIDAMLELSLIHI